MGHLNSLKEKHDRGKSGELIFEKQETLNLMFNYSHTHSWTGFHGKFCTSCMRQSVRNNNSFALIAARTLSDFFVSWEQKHSGSDGDSAKV